MICHAIRDLGVISRLNLTGVVRGRFDVELTHRVAPEWFLSYRFFNNPPAAERFPAPLHGRGGFEEGFLGGGGLVLLTYGAPPGSSRAPERFEEPPPRATGQSPYWQFVTHGPAVRARAEDSSARFIRDVREEIGRTPAGAQAWQNFLNSREGTSAP